MTPATEIRYHGNRWCTTYYATWLSPDPIGFEGGDANLYRNCGNDPVNAVDPTGLDQYILVPRTPYENSEGKMVLPYDIIFEEEHSWDGAPSDIPIKQVRHVVDKEDYKDALKTL